MISWYFRLAPSQALKPMSPPEGKGVHCNGPSVPIAGEMAPQGYPGPPGSKQSGVCEFGSSGLQGESDPVLSCQRRVRELTLQTEENKQLRAECGTRFLHLNSLLQDSRSLATCFWELTHLPRNNPLCVVP